MGLGIVPLMGIGAGLGLLRGGGIGGALKGAALGGAGGLIGNALQGSEAAIEGAKAIEGASQVGSFLPPTMAEVGAGNAFDFATNAPTGFGVTQAATNSAMPLISSGASSGGLELNPAASGFSRFIDGLPDYVTPDNVIGAANILSQSQPQQPRMPTSSASVSRGSQRQGNIDYGMAQPIRRRGIL